MGLIIFSSENSCVIRLSNSGFKWGRGKIIKIPYFLSNVDVFPTLSICEICKTQVLGTHQLTLRKIWNFR